MGRDRKNEKRGSRFVKLDHSIMDSPAWIELSGSARSVHLVLIRRFNGKNNGEIYAPTRETAKALGLGRNAVARALRELETAGFIVETAGPHLGSEGTGRASKWYLTHLPYKGKVPTLDFKKKQNPGTKAVQPLHQNRAKHDSSAADENPKVAPNECHAGANDLHQKSANLRIYHGYVHKLDAVKFARVHKSKGSKGRVIETSKAFKTRLAKPAAREITSSAEDETFKSLAQRPPRRSDHSRDIPERTISANVSAVR